MRFAATTTPDGNRRESYSIQNEATAFGNADERTLENVYRGLYPSNTGFPNAREMTLTCGGVAPY